MTTFCGLIQPTKFWYWWRCFTFLLLWDLRLVISSDWQRKVAESPFAPLGIMFRFWFSWVLLQLGCSKHSSDLWFRQTWIRLHCDSVLSMRYTKLQLSLFFYCQGSSGEFSTLAAVCRPIESAEFMLVLSMGWIDEFGFFQVEFWLTMLVVEVVGTTWTMPRSWQGTSTKKSAVPNRPKLNLTQSVDAKFWEFVGVFSFCCEALHFLVGVFGVRNA